MRFTKKVCDEIVDAALAAGLHDPSRRTVLLDGIDPRITANLIVVSIPRDQLSLDIAGLARLASSDDGAAMKTWLSNAARTVKHPKEAATFRRHLGEAEGEAEDQPAPDAQPPLPQIDVVLIVALRVEFEAVASIGGPWDRRIDRYGFEYAYRSFPSAAGRDVTIATSWAAGMGGIHAANRLGQMIEEFCPRLVAMSGICAGRKGKVALGDVIFADRVWMYDEGKITTDADGNARFQGDMHQDRLSDQMKTAIDAALPRLTQVGRDLPDRPLPIENQAEWVIRTLAAQEPVLRHPDRKQRAPQWKPTLDRLRDRKHLQKAGIKLTPAGQREADRFDEYYPDGLTPPPKFTARIGPIASGNAVRQDRALFLRLAEGMRKTLGVEMEVAAVARVAASHHLPWVVAKAVVDFADPEKDDHFREYASLASATVLVDFVTEWVSARM